MRVPTLEHRQETGGNNVLCGLRFLSTLFAVANPRGKSRSDLLHPFWADGAYASRQHLAVHDRQAANSNYARHFKS